MELIDRRILAAMQDGLPLVAEPFAAIGEPLGLSAAEVIARLEAMQGRGIIKRMGLVLRHHEFGYRANAMT
ncbi:MAG: Lrp/AsnC family transcriptional regulator, partial [Geminicoccaceae bacterium]|nr:Lrp/AsnC family transcriptional regulator [Geminicoccaceae bacterium]